MDENSLWNALRLTEYFQELAAIDDVMHNTLRCMIRVLDNRLIWWKVGAAWL